MARAGVALAPSPLSGGLPYPWGECVRLLLAQLRAWLPLSQWAAMGRSPLAGLGAALPAQNLTPLLVLYPCASVSLAVKWGDKGTCLMLSSCQVSGTKCLWYMRTPSFRPRGEPPSRSTRLHRALSKDEGPGVRRGVEPG